MYQLRRQGLIQEGKGLFSTSKSPQLRGLGSSASGVVKVSSQDHGTSSAGSRGIVQPKESVGKVTEGDIVFFHCVTQSPLCSCWAWLTMVLSSWRVNDTAVSLIGPQLIFAGVFHPALHSVPAVLKSGELLSVSLAMVLHRRCLLLTAGFPGQRADFPYYCVAVHVPSWCG